VFNENLRGTDEAAMTADESVSQIKQEFAFLEVESGLAPEPKWD
jgi:hypothetical protein